MTQPRAFSLRSTLSHLSRSLTRPATLAALMVGVFLGSLLGTGCSPADAHDAASASAGSSDWSYAWGTGEAAPGQPETGSTAALPLAPVPDKKYFASKVLINQPAPELWVSEWLSSVPDFDGKMVLVDFWATWCPDCREAIPELNALQEAFADRLVVVGLSSEPAAKVLAMHADDQDETPSMEYFSAIDRKERMHDAIGVQGIPHAVLIDPSGIVRWQGFPLDSQHPLSVDVMAGLLDTYLPGSK